MSTTATGVAQYMPHYAHMMGHLLNWTLRLEWAAIPLPPVFQTFEEKWQAVKDWPDSGIMGSCIMKHFLTGLAVGRDYNETDIKHDMPVAMKRRLYVEALEQFNTRHDPAYFGGYDPTKTHYKRIGCHYVLAKQIIEEEKDLFDEDFKATFQPYYDAVPPLKMQEAK